MQIYLYMAQITQTKPADEEGYNNQSVAVSMLSVRLGKEMTYVFR
jgi:hypothetical protein